MRRIVATTAVALLAVGSGRAAAEGTTRSGPHGHARAVAEAKALLADAPTIDSATPSATAPVKRLRHPPERPSYFQLVMRAHWWTVDESAERAYQELTAQPPAGYRESGEGGAGGSQRHDVLYFTSYQPRSVPKNIAYAQLLVAVAPTGKHTAAIGAYGQAVPRPHRPKSEHVPSPVHTTIVSRVRSYKDKHPRQRTMHGMRARALLRDFNALPASAPGVSSCGADFGQSDSVSFRAHGNVWVASTGACPGVAVVRDGKELPALDSTRAFSHDLRAALRRR